MDKEYALVKASGVNVRALSIRVPVQRVGAQVSAVFAVPLWYHLLVWAQRKAACRGLRAS